MSKGGNDTQTTTSAPWSELQPYLTGTPATEATVGTGGSYQTTTDPFTGEDIQTWIPGTAGTEASPGIPGLLPSLAEQFAAGPQSYYPGQTYADFTNPQILGQQGALDFAQGGMQQTANSTMDANRLMTSGDLLYANSNPYLQQNISDANSLIARDFNEQIMPQLRGGAQSAGQYDSSKYGVAMGQAAGRAADAMARNTNQMYNNAYNTGLNAMATGVGQSPTALKAGMSPYQLMQDIGGVQQQQSQLGINDAVNAYNFNQQAPWDNLGNYANILSGNYMGSGGTSTVPVTGSNPLMGALGGAATGYSFGGPVGAVGGGVIGLLSS